MYHLTIRKLNKIKNIKSKYMKKHAIFNHTLHKELWNWLYENPDKCKFEWPRWDFNGGDINKVQDNCFACEYTRRINPIASSCSSCPFDIDINKTCLNGLYDKYRYTHDLEIRKEIAKQIRDFPVKKGIRCI